MALSKVAVVEDCISAAFLELVVKLSENAFRPLFVKVRQMQHLSIVLNAFHVDFDIL